MNGNIIYIKNIIYDFNIKKIWILASLKKWLKTMQGLDKSI